MSSDARKRNQPLANLRNQVKPQQIVTDKATLLLTVLVSFKSSTKDLKKATL